MAVKRYGLILFLLGVFIEAISTRCPTIPLYQCKLAAAASDFVYGDHINVGDSVEDTNGFKVTKRINQVFLNKRIRVILAEKGSTTIVAFRGTASKTQLLQQGLSAMSDLTTPKQDDVWFKGKKVDILSFFWGAFNKLFPYIEGKLKDRNREYILTGHSLGGALASILALKMAVVDGNMWRNEGSALITFGQPRVGDQAYADLHDQRISPNKKIRFTFRNDVVPHIPPSPKYKHHSREIWIQKTGPWFSKRYFFIKVCGEQEPSKCSTPPKVRMWRLLQYHNMDTYKEHLNHPPKRFFNKYGKEESSFDKAEESSCV